MLHSCHALHMENVKKTDKNSGGKRRCSKKKRRGSKSRSAGGGNKWRIGPGATSVVGENYIFPGGEGCIFRQIAAHMLLRNNYKGRNIPLLTKEEKEEDCGGLGEHFLIEKCVRPLREVVNLV